MNRAFQGLKDLIPTLMANGLDQEVGQGLKAAINAAHTYYRSHLRYNLETESSVAKHCVTYSLSDPGSAGMEHRKACAIPHTDSCFHCDNIQNILQSLETALELCQGQFVDELDFEKCAEAVEVADDKIYAYHTHVMRSFAQNSYWEDLKQRGLPHVVLCTVDWAMKLIPQRFRETQSEFFGKKGMFNLSVQVF